MIYTCALTLQEQKPAFSRKSITKPLRGVIRDWQYPLLELIFNSNFA